MKFNGHWNDGYMTASISPADDGYHWHLDNEEGWCPTWGEAWHKMPALITHPDHFEVVSRWGYK
ncbi:MAG: hypothetical protein IE914_04515 [Thiotrichales bacterium]|nr:hypothetical protein [Thiotrichales bacterium]